MQCAHAIIKVVRCCLEHASSVAKTFLTSDVVVVDIKEPEPVPAGNPMDNSGTYSIESHPGARTPDLFLYQPQS